jgi:hypothetical protein
MVLVGKRERNKQLGWEDRSTVDLKGIKYGLQQKTVASFYEHGNIPAGFVNFGEFLDKLRNH